MSNQMPTLECAVATASGTNLSEEVVSKEEAKRTLLEGAASSQHSPSQEKEEKKHTQAASASAGAASVVEKPMEETSDMPYFPSHPFSIFPPDTTAAVTMETTPHQLAPMEEGHFCMLATDVRVNEKGNLVLSPPLHYRQGSTMG